MPANDNRKQQYLAADVANLEAHIADLMVAYPELAEDETLRADMLEGETSLYEVLTRLVSIERDASSMSAALASRIGDMQARKAREEKRKDAMRKLMLRVMQATGESKAKLVEATVSVGKGRDSVDVYDVDSLPDEFVKIERVPDKKNILEIVKGCGEIPGARLKTGEPTVTVRAA